MKTVFAIAQSLVPVFVACVGGLYLHQALNTPREIFTRGECWAIGLGAEALAVFLSLSNRFQWFT